MSDKSNIEWTETTWNPVVGCSKVSPGCDNCYAERMAYRLACMGRDKPQASRIYSAVVTPQRKWTGQALFVESAIDKPLHWKTPLMVFVDSMGDLFHPSVPFHWIDRVMAVIWECNCRELWHKFQFLTKRPDIMLKYYSSAPWPRVSKIIYEQYGRNWGGGRSIYPEHLWLGITAENHEWLVKRWRYLAKVPASVKFISHEPSLSKLVLPKDFLALRERGWMICGGESGPGARPMNPDWARGLRDQCKAADVPFFFKQWGEWMPDSHFAETEEYKHWAGDEGFGMCITEAPGFKHIHGWGDGSCSFKVGKKKAGCLLDGVEHKHYPCLASSEDLRL